MKTMTIYIHECLRCKWVFKSESKTPLRCAKCKTPYWNIPKKSSKSS